MAHLLKLGLFVLFALCLATQAEAAGTGGTEISLHEYTAIYQVLRNDKLAGEITIRLSRRDELWTLHGMTHDLRGMAKALNIKGSQTSTGKWVDGRFQAQGFEFAFSLIGFKTGWSAKFDWDSGIVTTRGKWGKSQLSLADGAEDPFSMSLNIRANLAGNQTPMTFNVIDEDVIESEIYAVEFKRSIDSALGCLQTTQLRRVRENTKRKSLLWYAIDYDHVPVLMHHSKKKGNKLELKIISLEFDGRKIDPVDACSKSTPE